MNTLKSVVFIIITGIVLSGCGENIDDGEQSGLKRIENFEEIEERIPEDNNYSFYLPYGMTAKNASQNFDAAKTEDYNTILQQLGSFEEKALMLGDSTYYQQLMNIVRFEQLGFSPVEITPGGYNINERTFEVLFNYRYTAEEMSVLNRESEAAAMEIIRGLSSDMTDYDKLKYFHDYLIKNCESDVDSPYKDTVYGTLVEKKALCEGYAKTFSYLCNLAGIENTIVTGDTGVNHVWNMVKLNGNWYHVDVTWDKPNPIIEGYEHAVLYQYFMVTDAALNGEREIWYNELEPPRAYSTLENYFLRENNKRYIKDKSEFQGKMEAVLLEAVLNKDITASIKFENTDVYDECAAILQNAGQPPEQAGVIPYVATDEEILPYIISAIAKETGVKFEVSFTPYYDEHKIMLFLIKYE